MSNQHYTCYKCGVNPTHGMFATCPTCLQTEAIIEQGKATRRAMEVQAEKDHTARVLSESRRQSEEMYERIRNDRAHRTYGEPEEVSLPLKIIILLGGSTMLGGLFFFWYCVFSGSCT